MKRTGEEVPGTEVSGTEVSGGEEAGGAVEVDWVGKGVMGGTDSSTGRVTVGVGAWVVFFPASTAETMVVMKAMADWTFMIDSSYYDSVGQWNETEVSILMRVKTK